MVKKAEKLEKAEDTTEVTPGTEGAPVEGTQPASTEEKPADAVDQGAKDEGASDKKEDAGDKDPADAGDSKDEDGEKGETPAMTKLAEAKASLEKISAPAKVEKAEELGLTKAVNEIAGTLAKMADLMGKQEERIAKLEKTPAAPKSRSVEVFKSEAEKAEVTKTDEAANPDLAAKEARLTELNKIFDNIGANDFAKQGLSAEASKLQNEIAELKNKTA